MDILLNITLTVLLVINLILAAANITSVIVSARLLKTARDHYKKSKKIEDKVITYLKERQVIFRDMEKGVDENIELHNRN